MNALFQFIKETQTNGFGGVQGYDAVALRFTQELGMTFKENDNYVLLDYCQIDSPRKHPVADMCRGIILTKDFQRIVCRPFDRFYNYGEYPELEKEFDFETARFDEKADGSLIKAWFDPVANIWQVGTRGSFFGDNCISTLTGEDGTITFRELWLRALGATEAQMQKLFNSCMSVNVTYLFELCTLENKIVTAYPHDSIFLLGARENKFGQEFTPIQLDGLVQILNGEAGLLGLTGHSIVRPTTHELDSFEAVVAASESLGGLKEGFVIRDGQNRRLKVKSTAYVTAHHMRGEGITPKRAVLLALSGEVPEFLAYFPEYTEVLTPYVERIEEVKSKCLEDFARYKDIENQRDYAMAVKDLPYNGFLFSMRKGKTFDQCVKDATTNTLVGLFSPRLKEEEGPDARKASEINMDSLTARVIKKIVNSN